MNNNKYAIVPDNLIQVPLVRQTFDYDCGAASLQSILGYYNYDIRLDELMAELGTKEECGTSYEAIVSYVENLGCEISVFMEMELEDLFSLLDDGVPVMVLIQAWSEDRFESEGEEEIEELYESDWEDGHYVVAVGYDEENIYFMDPSTLGAYPYIPIEEFRSRWHDVDTKQDGNTEELYNFAMVILDCPERETTDGGKLE